MTRLRIALSLSAVLLGSASVFLTWKIWDNGAVEGKTAWEEGRVVAISIASGEVQGGHVVEAPKKAEEETPSEKEEAAPATTEEPAELEHSEETPVPESEHSEHTTKGLPAPPVDASGALAAAPLPALTQKTAEGKIPVIGKDGTKPWQYYGRPAGAEKGSKLIAVIITDLGQNKNTTESALSLPAEMDLGFSPYAASLATWVTAARARGHEVLLSLPMEPEGFPANDPGPLALLSMNTEEENASRLRKLMAKAPGAIGFITPADEVFSEKGSLAKPVAEQIARAGLLVAGTASAFQKTATTASLPYMKADIILDGDLDADSVNRQLAATESLALQRGYAVAVTHGYPVVLNELTTWAENLRKRGFILIPLSALARMQFS